jgi:hypothetical protein
VAAAIVPHAPLLVPELHPQGHEQRCRAVVGALRCLPWGASEAVAVVSAHGERKGVYTSLYGTLRDLGPSIATSSAGGTGVAEELAGAAGLPLLEDPCDHGVLVPALLGLAEGLDLIGVSLSASWGGDESALLATAVEGFGGRLGLAASAHTGAALSPAAPLTELDGAKNAEQRWLRALRSDASSSRDHLDALGRVAGSCGTGPLDVLAAVGGDRRTQVSCYERPFGVGYLVASMPA